ncbi:carboxylate--amine ligase [Kitasatospora sp. MMS16-BH015]|uniref:carboxylate-amine ligase n=1 Tax=Kitasatospora sp. MMS16-BH015 TaxID=2018025 RepID=UPI000CA1BBBA|nr:glutamate--cysteine ligase [Kitasatospora sp. MMS16-BH015]AUG75599.1 carboxylate--amine ligase [Kitasatospora sp. MMS16-BH015]
MAPRNEAPTGGPVPTDHGRPTLGVEEEYLLLDPGTGLPVPRVDEVRRRAGLHPAVDHAELQHELLQAQVEIATPVCSELAEVGGHLLRLRHVLAAAAAESGCRLAACGTAPFAGEVPPAITAAPRYHSISRRVTRLADEALINGMHVHVAVPDPEAGVAVLDRLRGWLPVLTALSANSPLWYGSDTGYASWRTVVFGRWPVSGIPPQFADAADYDRRIEHLLEAQLIRDRGQVYWQARLSARFPTIEVRCMDVQLRADEAVLLAGLTRALVVTLLREHAAGTAAPDRTPESLQAAQWHAARHGLADLLHDPVSGLARPAAVLVRELSAYLRPVLEEFGDARTVTPLLDRLLLAGNGAVRQRRRFEEAGRPGLLAVITDETAAD